MSKKNKLNFKGDLKFTDSLILNNATFNLYYEALKTVALSRFEWVNLPQSMNSDYLEYCLFYNGIGAFLKDEKFGFINTNATPSGNLNIYNLPIELECYSFDFHTRRRVFYGKNPLNTEKRNEYLQNTGCILVQNNINRTPTSDIVDLFAYRLYDAQRIADVNINAQKTPVLIVIDEKQRMMMSQLYNQYSGNQPFIFGDAKQLTSGILQVLKTDAPYVADKIMNYKKEIWNEALMFLGINTILLDKKERLLQDEANANNEIINLFFQSYLSTRKKACDQFNEKYGFKGTDKEISVRVRSDLYNIIKQAESVITDYNDKKEGVENWQNIQSNLEKSVISTGEKKLKTGLNHTT